MICAINKSEVYFNKNAHLEGQLVTAKTMSHLIKYWKRQSETKKSI